MISAWVEIDAGLVAIGMGSVIHAEAEQRLRVALQELEHDTERAKRRRAAIRTHGARVTITVEPNR